MAGLSQFHFILGSAVVLAYVVVAILNLLRLTGRDLRAARMVSYLAAALLLLQYVIGGLLWGGGFQNNPLHYVIALLAVVPVGIEHGYAASRPTARQRSLTAALASIATAVLVLAAHGIGSAYDGVEAAALVHAWW